MTQNEMRLVKDDLKGDRGYPGKADQDEPVVLSIYMIFAGMSSVEVLIPHTCQYKVNIMV